MLKIVYVMVAVSMMMLIIYGKFFVFRKRDAGFVSDYCALMAVCLGVYVVLSLVYALICQVLFLKGLMLFFALSPFLLGLVANFYTEKYFTVFQVFLLSVSVACVI